MIAWYWILISIVMSNFLTVLLSNIINFENLWEDFLFTLFYPFVWIGNFPYAFLETFSFQQHNNNLMKPPQEQIKKLFINYLKMSIFGMIKRQKKSIITGF